MNSNKFLDAALSYIKKGWHVFPCLDKRPLTHNGYLDAFLDENMAHTWWDRPNPPDVAIATGFSKLCVLDIDAGKGGLDTLEELKKLHGELHTYSVRTGGGGLHFYFDAGTLVLPCRTGLYPGVDIRSTGGYVVAAPSRHKSGNDYQLLTAENIAPVPLWLVTKIFEQKPLDQKQKIVSDNGTIYEGGRNDYLTRMGGAMKRRGLSFEALNAALLAENEMRCVPPLEDSEVLRIASNLNRFVAADPESSKHEMPKEDRVLLMASEFIPSLLTFLKDKDALQGLPTGIAGLDALLGGGKRLGEITIWHAEAKTGKNTLWHKMMHLWLQKNIPIGYACRELSPAEEVLPSILSIHEAKNLRTEDLTEEIATSISKTVAGWPLYFAQGYGFFPLQDIFRWVMAAKASGVRHFWFDHLHYMIEEYDDHKESAFIMQQLKALAKQEQIHIDIIVQPNVLREGQKLSLSSIKGGSAIGQIMDNFITLERVADQENVMKLELKAKRFPLGKLGSIFLKYNAETQDVLEVRRENSPIPPNPPFRNGPLKIAQVLSEKRLDV